MSQCAVSITILHDEVGLPLRRGPAIQEFRDVRMIEVGKDPALGLETAYDGRRVLPAANRFDGDVVLELGIDAPP